MPEGIHHPSNPPSVRLVLNRVDHFGSGTHRLGGEGIRIIDDQDHPRGAAVQRCRAVVSMRRRFVGHPELCLAHGQPGDDGYAVLTDTKELVRSERLFVELHCLRAAAHRQHWLQNDTFIQRSLRRIGHNRLPSVAGIL
jgi:hypothetical protein